MPRPGPARYGALQSAWTWTPRKLDRRVERRVTGCSTTGWSTKVRTLEKQGLRDGRTASRALGTSRCRPSWTAATALRPGGRREATARPPAGFVRRQRSWFRRDQRVTWLDATRPDLVEAALALA